MLRLKTILQSSSIVFILFILTIIGSYIYASLPLHSNYSLEDTYIEGILTEYNIDGNKMSFTIKGKGKIKCTYYINSIEERDKLNKLDLGISIALEGSLSIPSINTIPNTFNYQKYLKSNKIKYIMNVNNISIKSNKVSFIYYLKNILIKHINTYKSSNYLLTFILGIKKDIDEDTYLKYQELGISHIFSISGMHISLLAGILLKVLKGIKQKYMIVIIFLFMYLCLVGPVPGVLRSILLFIFLYINKKYEFNLDIMKVFYITIITMLIYNPYYIYNIGFLYSSIISYSLIRYSKAINGNYITSILKVSLLALLISLPITINNNYQINILSTIYNLFYVPFISFIIYPLSLITLIIKPLDNILFFLISILENITKFIPTFNIVFPKLNIVSIIVYYSLTYVFLNTYQKKYLMFIIIMLLTIKYSYILDNNYYIYYLDVGQGDSSIIKYKDKTIMIDTGGIQTYYKEEWEKRHAEPKIKTTITFLKSIGVTKLDYLIITHGDYDHMGDAINLVSNFKVEKVIFNCGEYNTLEKELINKLNNINYYSCIKELNINKNKLYFLQTKDYDNENDNSNVIYMNINNHKLLFMGDASVTTEKEILNNYNINNIDILKVGHHGSNTSSSKEFIDKIKPKYSIISAGKNNRYGHPNKEVLDNLNTSKIYRTDYDGSIMFKINNKLLVRICCQSKGND